MRELSEIELERLTGAFGNLAAAVKGFLEKQHAHSQEREQLEHYARLFSSYSEDMREDGGALVIKDEAQAEFLTKGLLKLSADMARVSSSPFLLMLAVSGTKLAEAFVRGDIDALDEVITELGLRPPA
jgi:hypothetical protein